jgi:DNA polymerase-4
MTTLCRDCGALVEAEAARRRCEECGSMRLVAHPELGALAIAHLDCDAFYASIEKRDDPALADRPVIVGGGQRGVVAACCYVARLHGVRSAMPMFKALKACPDAVVIRPNMAKYRAAGREVRRLMLETTPLVQPLSIDEAFLDLFGTEQLHHGPPARTLALLARRIEREIGITVSIGLAYNKFLAKIASDLDKPRGFAVIGRGEAVGFLDGKPTALIWGVGAALQRRLAADGILTIGDIRRSKEAALVARYGVIGRRLARFARGEDDRAVTPDAPTKSVSAETTFERDTGRREDLVAVLRPLAEQVAARLRQAGLAAATATLKLKTADFRLRTRSHRLEQPTQRAEILLETALSLLDRELDGTLFRLAGIGADGLVEGRLADPPGLFDAPPQQVGFGSASMSSRRALIEKSP